VEKMEIIEIVALVAAVIVLIKVVMNLVKPAMSLKKAKNIMKNENLVKCLYAALVVITGYVAISEIGIVNAFAAVLFGASLVGLTLVMYPNAVLKMMKSMFRDKNKMILPMLVWAALAIWTIYTLYVNYIGI
jgi:hypothetical protein